MIPTTAMKITGLGGSMCPSRLVDGCIGVWILDALGCQLVDDSMLMVMTMMRDAMHVFMMRLLAF